MFRSSKAMFLLLVLAITVACTNKKVNNPIANVDSKQPDKVLFDRAMDAMKHNRFDVARLSLQTLINTYPDSEFVARAKLAIADSWYAEGGSSSLAEAEIQYKDFETFFPNMPEAAEAQLKIANIHYQEMEKPDRDYTHAMRAEEEYRQLILQYPDSKLVPQAKQKLREVQEVIAEREFEIGRFYYLRETYPAGIARLRSLVDKYPLYSKADEALYLLGQSYEGEVKMLRTRPTCSSLNPPRPPGCMIEDQKARMIEEFTKGASEAYSRILTRYPVMDRADDARLRLAALHQPIPRPTKAAVAQNKAEEDSRHPGSMLSKAMRTFEKHPDVSESAKVGEPTLVDPTPMSASEVVQRAAKAAVGTGSTGGDKDSVSVEQVGTGEPGASDPTPRSDAPAKDGAATGAGDSTTTTATPAATNSTEQQPSTTAADPNELKPNVSSDGGQASPPPQQVNEIQNGPGGANGAGQAASDTKASDATSAGNEPADDSTIASSKKKKKKGIHKVVPF